MEWPNRFLLIVLCLAVAAVVAPWLIPRSRRGFLFGFVAAFAATACWVSYEKQLHLIAPPGDPLIRVDLLLIVPLILLDWLSGIAAIAVARFRGRTI